MENGKQTATPDDLDAWAAAAGAEMEAADLKGRLRGLESQQRSWRRQLATGHRGVQEKYVAEHRLTSVLRGYETTVIPGLFQTPDYARHLLIQNADLMESPRDTDAALLGLSSVTLGIVPLGAPLGMTPKHGFWIFNEQRVIVEIISTELQLESDEDVALYRRVWDRLAEAAVEGPVAQRLIVRARASLDLT
ncbi:Scr1 family TA system antitoxin-like transcriptional regulator [Streptomyces sp. NPDC002215]|uniref:Scr1 family TA system antitoxin-like transcriptional regulator n=1 Tax=Streptomyces sp. NPDC002215 TaxID=3154412 RepID=UPI00332466AD